MLYLGQNSLRDQLDSSVPETVMWPVTFCKNEKLEKQAAGQLSSLDPYNTLVWVSLKFCDLGTIYFFSCG